MAEPTKLDVEMGIDLTTMAIRENLMQYFKGSCIDSVIAQTNVGMASVNHITHRYQYQREEFRRLNPQAIYIGQEMFMRLERPAKAILYMNQFNRSPELTEVGNRLKTFFNDYLIGVEVTEDNENYRHDSEFDDRKLVCRTKIRDGGIRSREEMTMVDPRVFAESYQTGVTVNFTPNTGITFTNLTDDSPF